MFSDPMSIWTGDDNRIRYSTSTYDFLKILNCKIRIFNFRFRSESTETLGAHFCSTSIYLTVPEFTFLFFSLYIIGHNYHGHYLHAGGLSVNNYVRESKVREVNVRE